MEEIDYGKLGQIACCSSYHFQRMFAYMAGVFDVSTCNDMEPWKYYIAVSTLQAENDLEEYIVPAAAFQCTF